MSAGERKPRLDVGALIGALNAACHDDENESSRSSTPLSYRSNGHDGLTDVDDMDSDCGGLSAATGPVPLPTPLDLQRNGAPAPN